MVKIEPVKMDLFGQNVPEDILYVIHKLQEAGFEVYLVGGAVRNIIIKGGYDQAGLRDSDFDFATNAKPAEVIALFREKGKSRVFTIPTGLSHGTVTIVIEKNEESFHYEITTYRTEGTYTDGRHPTEVRFSGSILEDLSRRDFTINALAYDVPANIVLDPFGGLKDIKHKLIRTVGEPEERFGEDGLRPLRACRIAAQLGFKIDKKTLDAIPGTLEIIKKVSQERVHDEFIKMMRSVKPSVGIEYMRETGILELFIPELLEGFAIDQNEFHKHDVYYHNLFTCDAVFSDKPLVRMAALFHDIGKPRAKKFALANGNGNVFYNHEMIGERLAERILKRLKFSNTDLRKITKLVKMHMFYYTEEWSDGAVRRFLRKIDGDMGFLSDLFELRKADRIGSGLKSGETDILNKFKKRINSIIEEDSALKVTDLKINGNEIMERFRLKPSRVIGEMLEAMLEKVLDHPEWNTRENLFAIGEEFLKNQGDQPVSADEKDNISILI